MIKWQTATVQVPRHLMHHWCILCGHIDMLQDYTHELQKFKANSLAVAAKENLMGSIWRIWSHTKVELEKQQGSWATFERSWPSSNLDSLIEETIALLWQQKTIWIHKEECSSQLIAKWTCGLTTSSCEQPDSEAQPWEASKLIHPQWCGWHLYHPIAALCLLTGRTAPRTLHNCHLYALIWNKKTRKENPTAQALAYQPDEFKSKNNSAMT